MFVLSCIIVSEVEKMECKQFVKIATATAGITQAELAARLGWSPQLLNNRLKTGKFTLEEWQRIAAALGADLLVGFQFPNGKTVTL